MPDLPTEKRKHVFRRAETCGEWCIECRVYDKTLPLAFLGGLLVFLLYMVTLGAPIGFQDAALVKVEKGSTVAEVAEDLKEKHLIRSTVIFQLSVRLFGGEDKIIAGGYFFAGPQDVLTIARRMVTGDFELTPVRVTVPEGSNNREIAEILGKKLIDFDTSAFLEAGEEKEGYLFPDTYFFLPGEDPEVVLFVMEQTFKDRIESASTTLSSSGKTLKELVIMASLLEKEASNTRDRRMIAGVLWKRIDIGMPLQVDAVFPYIIGKYSLQLTRADLRTESPYNTYTNKGLPPGPIGSPSLNSILAAAEPVKSNYLYYLADRRGVTHYSSTYAQHLALRAKYYGN